MSASVAIDYAPLLTQWSRELHASDLGVRLGVTSGDWLGTAPADAATIDAAEARLGVALPPSYRAFLATSNGWGPMSPFVDRLRPAAAIDWYAVEHQADVDAWDGSDDGEPDTEYFVYDDDRPWFRRGELGHTLLISDGGDGHLLLNPRAVTPDREWECWFLAAWIPGANRFASFAHWLAREYESFRRLECVDGPMPPMPAFAVPPPGVKRKAIRVRQPKPAPRPFEELLAAMSATNDAVRQKATREFFGRVGLRGRTGRRQDLLEPTTQLFRSSGDADVRAACLSAITAFADDAPPTPAALLEGLHDPDAAVVGAAVYAMHWLASDDAFDDVARIARSAGEARDRAIGVLDRFDAGRAVPVLAAILRDHAPTDGDPHFRAALALALCGDAALPALADALGDADARVRFAATCALCQFGPPSTLDLLRPMLDDPDARVREWAALFCRAGATP